MPEEKSPREQAIGVIGEYLTAAELCVATTKPDGNILGYAAILLLLCATDAIGNGVLTPIRGKFTRLDVLAEPLFGQALTVDQASRVTDWYRNLLAHSGTMAIGARLEPHAQGQPFEFDTDGSPILIRVGKFLEIVSSAWAQVNKATFNPPPANPNKAQPNQAAVPPGFASSLTAAASGVI